MIVFPLQRGVIKGGPRPFLHFYSPLHNARRRRSTAFASDFKAAYYSMQHFWRSHGMKTIFLIKGSYHHCTHSLRAELSGRSGGGAGKGPCSSPSTELSDFRQSARSWNECLLKKKGKHARAKVHNVITNVISANQHFASTFSKQLSFLFPPSSQSFRETLLAGYCTQKEGEGGKVRLHVGYVLFNKQKEGSVRGFLCGRSRVRFLGMTSNPFFDFFPIRVALNFWRVAVLT